MIPKSRMPEIDQNELIAHVEWNENINKALLPRWIIPCLGLAGIVAVRYRPCVARLTDRPPKSRMPEIDQNELIAHVEWNENIHIDENRKRVTEIGLRKGGW